MIIGEYYEDVEKQNARLLKWVRKLGQRINNLEYENGNLKKENLVLKKQLKEVRGDFQEEKNRMIN